MSNSDQFVTYWPNSKSFYSGNRIDHDPGVDSPHLLASMVKTDKGMRAELKSKELIQSARQIKSADAIANDTNLEHLQVIKLHEVIQGAPDQTFFLENASTIRNVDKLESRETWRSLGDTVRRKGRLEETKEKITKYAEIKYDVEKLTGKVYTPAEDTIRTITNPETIDIENLNWEFKYARNIELKDVIIKGITRDSAGAGGHDDIGSMALPSGTTLHSATNVGNKFAEYIKAFRVRNRMPIDTVIFSVAGWNLFASNTWNGQDSIEKFPNGGMTQLKGFPGITAIIEPELMDSVNRIYFLNKANGLRTAQGPILTRRFYDENKHASAVSMLDFVEFLSVDKEIDHSLIGDRYFSFLASYT